MSRLADQQKKRFRINLLIAAAILVIVVVLISTVGLNILLNTSLFVARLSQNKSSQPLSKNENFIGDVDIYSIPIATNSPQIIVGGTVVNFDKIEFYLNGELVKEVPLLTSDNFSEEIGDLEDGDNEVFVIAKAEEQNSEKKSKTYNVLYKSQKPYLEIIQPQDGLKTLNQEIIVSGSTDKETFIKVNDLPVVVDAQANFQTSVRLVEGENKITVIAQDIANNQEEITITVFYEKE